METKIINIDSTFKLNDSESSSNFNYDIENLKNVLEIKLSSVELPNTSYVFEQFKNNNKFIISAPNNDPSLPDNTYTIEIPYGNYTSASIINTMNQIFVNVNFLVNLEATVNINSGLVTIKADSNFTIEFPQYTEYPSLGQLLGYKEKKYENNNIHIGQHIINVIDYNYCFMKLNDYGYVYNGIKKYFSKIIITNKKYEMSFEGSNNFVTKTMVFKQPKNINKLNIQLFDPYNKLIDMNGIQFSLTLEFKYVNNEILKSYKELIFYDADLMERILNDKMLDFFSNNDNKNISSTYDNIAQNQYNTNNIDKNITNTINNNSISEDETINLKKIENNDLIKRKKKIAKKRRKKLKEKFKY